MGIFSHAFGRRESPRKEWLAISSLIAENLEYSRNKWLDLYVRTLSEARLLPETHSTAAQVVGPLLAYQLMAVSSFIAAKQYINPKNGNRFADVLYAAACGPRLHETLAWLDKYMQTKDLIAAGFVAAQDIAQALTGSDANLPAVYFAVQFLPLLIILADVAVAEAFGDSETATLLSRKAAEIPDQIRQAIIDNIEHQ